MAYEFVDDGHYIAITEAERATASLESSHTIEIDQFVPRSEIDDLYLKNPYYLIPDGEVAGQAYAVIRQASDIPVAAGRSPNTAGIGLEAVGVELDRQ
jgi:DNA end-binding protein Ku